MSWNGYQSFNGFPQKRLSPAAWRATRAGAVTQLGSLTLSTIVGPTSGALVAPIIDLATVNAGNLTFGIRAQGGSSQMFCMVRQSVGPWETRWNNQGVVGFSSAADAGGTPVDAFLTRDTAATLQMGSDAAAPVAQTLKGCDARAGTDTDAAGGNFTLAAGRNTGSAAGGSLFFQTAPAGASGTGAGTLTTRLTIDSVGLATFAGSVSVVNTLTAANLSTTGSTATINQVQVAAGNGYFWNGRSAIYSPSDGVIRLSNNALGDFTRLQFGGTTASFPALARSTTSLKCRLADDSADAAFTALSFQSANPSGGTAQPWKLGSLVTAGVTPDITRYIELDVNGTLYKVIIST